ncbi:MAG TPA: DHA2 family efflux MFS transporter permease subunit [Parachlamydiaceae bacterium]|nr:DHA2 family efflux MFS transporter permease subunit [Parachlamydiaceae bacterium]
MENEKKSLEPLPLLILTLALGMGTFIQILDTSIANVSIPYIAGDLGVSPNEGTWVITSFAVSNAIVLPLTGLLASRYTDVKVFIWSTFLFSLASWACGLAWSLPSLIIFRIIQGATGGTLIPLSQSLLLKNYPPDKKGLALGFWSTVVIVAPILGPILGGWITDNYGWRWIFYINIPIGFLSTYLTYALIGGHKQLTEKKPLDLIGLILLIAAVGSLQVMLDKGDQWDWFSSPFILKLAFVSFVGFYFFIPWNYLSKNPVVDFSCFCYRNFTIATILSAIGYLLFFGSVVLMPLWLQTEMGYTAFWAGVAIAPIGIIPLFLSVPIGKYIQDLGAREFLTISFFIFGITFYWFSGFMTDISLYKIMLPRFVQGLAVACFFVPLVTIALSPIPTEKLSSASGVFNFIRLIAGGGIGTSLFVSYWNRWHQYYHARLTEVATIYNPATHEYLESLKVLGITGDQALKMIDSQVNNQAFILALNDVFYFASMAFFVLIPFIWLASNPDKKDPLEKPLISE